MTSIQRTGVAVLLVLLVIFGIYKYGYKSGWGDRDAEMQAQIAKKNEEAREKEQAMTKAVADKETELRKANDVVNKKQTDLNRLLSAGRLRLPSAGCVQTPAAAAPAAGNSAEARAEPDRQADQNSDAERETIRLIAQITADGDRAINQLNACIDAYNEIRNIANAQR